MEINAEQREALFNVARLLQKNAMLEAESSKGYIEQQAAISAALEVVTDPYYKALLERIDAETSEKISDELQHNESLIAEFVALTGIEPAKD